MHIIRYMSFMAMVLLFSGSASAQTFIITPNDSLSSTGYREDMQSLMIYQKNTSNNTIAIKWRKVSASLPANWDATICDNYICYGSLVDSGQMNSIAPDTSGYLLLHVTSHVNYGTAVVRYAVWDVANPGLKDTLTFIVTVNNNTAISEAAQDGLRVYPNPVQHTLHLSSDMADGFSFAISDLTGREIQRGNSADKNLSLPLDHIASGIYCITLSDKDKNTYTQKFTKE